MLTAASCLLQHSFFYMTKAAVPHLQKVKGSIVNNASVRLPNFRLATFLTSFS